jgi:hypothetical protein
MGSLKPDATYIYERVNGTIYAREFGESERHVAGFQYDPVLKKIADDYFFETEWRDIINASKTNSALQEALDRVKILYHLSKEDGKE